MKVLFISSGNKGKSSGIISAQAESLINQGLRIDSYLIRGKGLFGYLKNIRPLRNSLKKTHYDLVHAHYSYSAFAASIAGARPLVISLMGSDVKANRISRIVIRLFCFLFSWKCVIVKSEDMKQSLGMKKAHIIPNGVNCDCFKLINRAKCQQQLGWDQNKKHLLFAAIPRRIEKNFDLIKTVFKNLMNSEIELHILENVPYEKTVIWYNAADVVLLSSLWEGSPNVIKEAMACNRPIVATNVGDIAWLFGNTEGCYLTTFDPKDVADKINQALDFSNHHDCTSGRERIIELGLAEKTIAEKIICIYKKVLEDSSCQQK
jgi:teichuronic acid biosynthesis glycosyltransferase TuaC